MSNIKLNNIFKTVCIASDHAGFNLKEDIKNHLVNKKVSIFDIGPYSNKSVDYPDYAKKLGNRIKQKKDIFGRKVNFRKIKDNNKLPIYLIRNKKRFKHLII